MIAKNGKREILTASSKYKGANKERFLEILQRCFDQAEAGHSD
jgi:hypothetical protein